MEDEGGCEKGEGCQQNEDGKDERDGKDGKDEKDERDEVKGEGVTPLYVRDMMMAHLLGAEEWDVVGVAVVVVGTK